jgi:hypothetical protein
MEATINDVVAHLGGGVVALKKFGRRVESTGSRGEMVTMMS